jgi:hypothetical protein
MAGWNRFTRSLAAVFLSAVLVSVHIALATAEEPGGAWEGEIEYPARPVVLTADFTAGAASLNGVTPVVLSRRGLSTGNAAVEFEVAVGPQRTLRFAGARSQTRINGLVDTGDRKVPFWLEKLPEVTKPADRITAWRQDLDAVITRFLRYDRSFGESERAAARARLEKLKASVGKRQDVEILVELARAVAMSGNAHTRLYLLRNRTELRRWPIRLWWFRDELRVVRAAPEHVDLLGCRLVRIGGLSTADAFRRVRDIKAGNDSWQRYMSSYFLSSPDILFGAGVIDDPERVAITVTCGGATRRAQVSPLPLRKTSAPVEAWWDLLPTYPSPEPAFSSALSTDRASRYLLHGDQNYWFEYVPELAAIYFQFNRAQQVPTNPMGELAERMAKDIDQRPVKALVVDVRFNTGGDAGVGTPLVEKIAGKLGGIPVFVLTGRATFSAGIIHAAQWKQFAGAAVIGERVGDDLDFWAEGGNLVLPHSQLTVHYANAFHAYSQREYPQFRPYFADLNVASLEPDIVAEPSWADYASGRDPVFEAAAARIRRGRR